MVLGFPYKKRSVNIATSVYANLAELPSNIRVTVDRVTDETPNDPIARRLRDLGFVSGEPVHVVARAPFGGDPLVVQIGSTRFALRRAEAARIMLAT